MKPLLSLLVLLVSAPSLRAAPEDKKPAPVYQPVEGDVVFQSSPNRPGLDLVDAIEGSTGSPYSHCGMVFKKDGEWMVIEAVGPVKHTPLQQWIAHGREGKIWAYRVAEEFRKDIPAALAAMNRDLGKPYDRRYQFDDGSIYCSELIWRGWKAATGRELGKVVKLGDLNWQPYREVIEAIEGKGNIPLERKMITPRDLALAKELTLVHPVTP